MIIASLPTTPDGYWSCALAISWLVRMASQGRLDPSNAVDEDDLSAAMSLAAKLGAGHLTAWLQWPTGELLPNQSRHWRTDGALRDIGRGYIDVTGEGVLVLGHADGTTTALSSHVHILFEQDELLAAYGFERTATARLVAGLDPPLGAATSDGTLPKMPSTSGKLKPKSGLNYDALDEPLLTKMFALIKNKQARGVNDAARVVCHEATGTQNLESKRKRLISKYNPWLRRTGRNAAT